MPRPEPPGGELESLLAVERRLDAELEDARREAEGILRAAEAEERAEDERLEAQLSEQVQSRRSAHAERLESRSRRLAEEAGRLAAALERLDDETLVRVADRLLEGLLAAPCEEQS